MQTAVCFVQPFSPPKSALKVKDPVFAVKPPTSIDRTRVSPVKAALSFNYNSAFSVFPAEACDTVGGDACSANMFPEAKLNIPRVSSKTNISTVEEVDRDYFDYDSESHSVLREEACDDLGGEFCAAT